MAFENLMALQKYGQVDAVVCTSEDISIESRQEITVIHQGKLSFIRYMAANFGVLSWQALLTAPVIHTRLNNDAEGVLSELLRTKDYDEVFVDFTQCLLLLSHALAQSGKNPKVTACIHDVFAQRMIRSRRLVDIALTGVVCRQEQKLIGFLDSITVLNTKDRELIRSLYSATTVEVKPFFPPDWCANVNRRPDLIDPTKIVFFGNFDRPENSSAAKWFVANAMAEIQSVIPGATLILVGTGSNLLARQIDVVHVVGTGFVEDPSKYFSSCGCSIAPLFEGAGVKFKVLEALACGVPVIGTEVACEGITPQPMLLHAESSTFAAETIRILQLVHNMQSSLAIH